MSDARASLLRRNISDRPLAQWHHARHTPLSWRRHRHVSLGVAAGSRDAESIGHPGLFWHRAVEEHWWAFSRSALHKRLERSGLNVDLHKYFLLGANQLFVCAANESGERPT
jgi:hypothetical protein